MVDGTKYGSSNKELIIYRHIPKGLDTSKGPCIIYIHGSAFVIFNAELLQGDACSHALLNKCVVYNVDYGKAPESKFPEAIHECYAATKYILTE